MKTSFWFLGLLLLGVQSCQKSAIVAPEELSALKTAGEFFGGYVQLSKSISISTKSGKALEYTLDFSENDLKEYIKEPQTAANLGAMLFYEQLPYEFANIVSKMSVKLKYDAIINEYEVDLDQVKLATLAYGQYKLVDSLFKSQQYIEVEALGDLQVFKEVEFETVKKNLKILDDMNGLIKDSVLRGFSVVTPENDESRDLIRFYGLNQRSEKYYRFEIIIDPNGIDHPLYSFHIL